MNAPESNPWDNASPAAKRMIGYAIVAAEAERTKAEYQASIDKVAAVITGTAPVESLEAARQWCCTSPSDDKCEPYDALCEGDHCGWVEPDPLDVRLSAGRPSGSDGNGAES